MSTAPGRPPKRRSARTGSAPANPAAPPAGKVPFGGDLLKAGLKALDDARGEVVTRHSRFFEALLGIDAAAGTRKAKELFTLPTFENLFDERVARSLERLGTAQALSDLRQQIAALDERLQRLEQQQKPRAPRSKR